MTWSSLQTPSKNVLEGCYMEGGYGEEGAESECRECQDHDLCYRPGPIAELSRVPMCHLPHRSRQH